MGEDRVVVTAILLLFDRVLDLVNLSLYKGVNIRISLVFGLRLLGIDGTAAALALSRSVRSYRNAVIVSEGVSVRWRIYRVLLLIS